ncbi:DUF2059 domain-containing protein [Parashewanella curva]|uniref:DUF2059 domain-containing protein n=1 Tax=Parashewanella curva TaxID=2338552 RepID=A0A3L8PTQ0_9GAMM|nr:DUF2059 domain-containing protein [Parashewanella curva]RLV58787.1 DUF2059 domain-containing protein [Parashewanella curva]
MFKLNTLVKAQLLVATLFLSAQASADEQSKREAVNELIKETNVSALVDSGLAQMNQMMKGTEKQLGIREDEKEIFERHMQKVRNLIKAEFSWKKMEEPVIEIYMKRFTEKEIRDSLAFYRTESGKSMLKKCR